MKSPVREAPPGHAYGTVGRRQVKRRRRSAGLVACASIALAACVGDPGPTDLPAMENQPWVEWENRSEHRYVVTMADRGGVRAYGEVGPCSAGGMGMDVQEPFSIGLLRLDPRQAIDIGRPAPQVTDSQAWREAGDDFLLVVIHEDAGVTIETIEEQRSISDGLCP